MAKSKDESPTFFSTQSDFREWMKKNHNLEKELWVGYYKKATKIQSITWPESVDEGLCFGWIDGIRKSIDEKSYKIRFTPRKSTSIWSAVNIKRIQQLMEVGLVMPEGLAAYERRRENKSEVYSYEQRKADLPAEYQKLIKKNKKAWEFWNKLAPSYKKATTWWVVSAKKEETRLRRLNILIESAEQGLKVPPLRRTGK